MTSNREVKQIDLDNLGTELLHPDDPRWHYDLSPKQASHAWPCSTCGVRRDEHADQGIPHRLSSFNITDHAFTLPRICGYAAAATRPVTVWMIAARGDEFQWVPRSLHATRELALAALPAGCVHDPGDPDPDMCEPETWTPPRGDKLRIKEWAVDGFSLDDGD